MPNLAPKWSLVGTHTTNAALSSSTLIAVPAGATAVIVQAISQNIRFTMDGSNPTTTKGFQLRAGDPAVRVPVQSNTALRFIEETSAATLQYQFIQEYEVGS